MEPCGLPRDSVLNACGAVDDVVPILTEGRLKNNFAVFLGGRHAERDG